MIEFLTATGATTLELYQVRTEWIWLLPIGNTSEVHRLTVCRRRLDGMCPSCGALGTPIIGATSLDQLTSAAQATEFTITPEETKMLEEPYQFRVSPQN